MQADRSSENGHSPHRSRYVFGDFEVDAVNRVCSHGPEPVILTGKVLDTLLAFLDAPNRLLTKDELIERIWPGEFVEEGNLARNVSTLRKALGDSGREHRFIVTVPGHGYRFIADVSELKNGDLPRVPKKSVRVEELATSSTNPTYSRKWLVLLSAALVLFVAAWLGKDRVFPAAPPIKSLAVLPMKGIDPKDNYLGVGIADAVIRRLSASGQMTVRPTSAVLHYLDQDTDTLAAAHELNTDAVLEGNVQRSGERLRVSVNLLRAADGNSVWNDSFELVSADIFRVQDEVAQHVADNLRIRLGAPRDAPTAKYPTDPAAYEAYVKGIFSLDHRGYTFAGTPQMMSTIGFFKRSIEIDPNYALAHAELAVSYAWMALFIQPQDPHWADLAKEEIVRAEELDHNVAESHLAQALLDWSFYGGYRIDSAVNELRTVKRLDPNFASPDLAAIYGHIGMDDQARRELDRILAIDPTSRTSNDMRGILPYLRGDPDGLKAVVEDELNDDPLAPWYYLRKGSLDIAQKMIDERLSRSPNDYDMIMQRGLVSALRGKASKAEAGVPKVFELIQHNDESYHHETYDAACIYALDGKSGEAVKWLRETANTGFPNYPLFARDPFLDGIRQSPEFIQFMAEQKAQWERFEQDFADA